jgi:hypothetical protein
MNIVEKIKGAFRRRPLTQQDLDDRAEAKVLREHMLQDRVSQESGAGEVYRSERRDP